MDNVDEATRSKIMSSVGQRDTEPEMVLRKAMHHQGYRYRLNVKELPGSPDLVFPKYKAVVFVHGCFWHFHGCKKSSIPSTREKYWKEKFEKNKERDQRKIDKLLQMGWRVAVVWSCTLEDRNKELVDKTVKKVGRWLNSNDSKLIVG